MRAHPAALSRRVFILKSQNLKKREMRNLKRWNKEGDGHLKAATHET